MGYCKPKTFLALGITASFLNLYSLTPKFYKKASSEPPDLPQLPNPHRSLFQDGESSVSSLSSLWSVTIRSYTQAQNEGRYTGPFDLVYLWANNTKEWNDQRNLVKAQLGEKDISKKWSPTRDNGELKLSLRSVEKHLPWIRNIYILSNGQQPLWIDDEHPRIRFVDTNKLISDLNGTVPNFNSHAIYLASAFIDGLSEIYLQMDDDFVIGQRLPPDFFYWGYKHEVSPLIDWAGRKDLLEQKELVFNMLPGFKMKWAAHTPRCWNRTRVQALWDLYPTAVSRTIRSQLRSNSDIDLTSFYAPFVKAHYGQPIYMFSPSKKSVFVENENRTVFKSNEGQQFVFYDTAKQLLMKNFTEKTRPLLLCMQDAGNETSIRKGLRRKQGGEASSGNDGIASFDKVASNLDLRQSSFERDERPLLMPSDINVFGHRGVGFPLKDEAAIMENTIESFTTAVAAGVKWVELDVGVTADGVVIVGHFHQNLYEDCSIGKATVTSTNYSDLCAHAITNGLPIPSRLADILHVFKGQLGFQIELKQDTDYKLAQLCNKAVVNNSSEPKCSERAHKWDELVVALVNVLEESHYPENKIIISSFEAPRLNNFRRISPSGYTLRLVGAQSAGIDGMIRICQMYLGNKPAVSIPLQFATSERVNQLKAKGLQVEIGLPSAGSCLSKKFSNQNINEAKINKEIQRSIDMHPDSINTDFPRNAIEILEQNIY